MDSNPYEEDDFGKSSEYLRLALRLLAKYRVPPSPLNYRIGYDCVAGKNLELAEEISHLNDTELDSAKQFWSSYQRFYVQDHETFDQIRRELRKMVSQAQQEFQNSGKQLAGYSVTLDGFSRVLEENSDSKTMKSNLQHVLQDTQTMQVSQGQMVATMAQIISEVDALKKELDQVKEEANTDSLTGIHNRKAFDAELEATMRQASEQDKQFSLLMIDIDHFKKFNDTYGHLVGDKVLKYVAATLKRCLKGKDLAARYGGEEFGVILPETDERGAMVVAEQIRAAISGQHLKDSVRGTNYGQITASIGVGVYHIDEKIIDLIERTDQALYRAKSQGRNRVLAASKG